MRAIAVVVVFLCTAIAHADDWPQWRGPKRDGVAPNARLPKAWPKQFPQPRWKAVVGEGYASPVVADGRVFIMGRIAGGREKCWCFDADTGKPVWSHSYDAPFVTADARSGLGPKSTPTVEGGLVTMLGAAGQLHCFETATGRIVWQRSFGKEYWGVKKDKDGDDAWSTCCGAATSPLVDGERLIIPVGGEKAGGFTAFDKRTGAIAWKSLTDRSSYASPLASELAGFRQIVGFTGLRMVGLDANDGKLLWQHPFPAEFEQTIITPVLWKDLVIVGGEGRPTFALKIERKGDEVVKRHVWQNKDLRGYMSTPVVHGNHLYGLSEHRRQLVCVDLTNGESCWTEEGYPTYASFVVAGDEVLVLGSDGHLEVFAADPTAFVSRGRWKVALAGDTWSHLAVAGNRMYLKDRDTLFCFDFPERKIP